jgi:hypothetical protein
LLSWFENSRELWVNVSFLSSLGGIFWIFFLNRPNGKNTFLKVWECFFEKNTFHQWLQDSKWFDKKRRF